MEALRVITEHLAPGRWSYARQPTKKELAATSVLALPFTEASVTMRFGEPGPAADLRPGIGTPEHIRQRG